MIWAITCILIALYIIFVWFPGRKTTAHSPSIENCARIRRNLLASIELYGMDNEKPLPLITPKNRKEAFRILIKGGYLKLVGTSEEETIEILGKCPEAGTPFLDGCDREITRIICQVHGPL